MRRAGAIVLFAAPGFYHGAESVEELVDFMVGRAASTSSASRTRSSPSGARVSARESGRCAPEDVRSMFDRIAPVYDVMNRVMTAGLDRRWRRRAAAAVVRPGDRVLDACCGTGDLAVAARRRAGA